MLLRIFRSQSPVQFLLLLPLFIGLWYGSLGNGIMQSPANFDPGLYRFIFNHISSHPVSVSIITILLVALQAIVLNYMLIRNNLSLRNNLLPAFIFILLSGSTPSLTQLSAPMIASFFILLGVAELLSMYDLKDPFTECFNASFFITIASCFYFPAISFFLLIWISFLIYRVLSWREWIISLIGFFAAALFIWFYFFWNNQEMVIWNYIRQFFSHPEHFQVQLTKMGYILWGIVALIFLSSLANLMNHINEKVIAIRRKYWVIIFTFFIALFSFVYANQEFKYHTIFLTIPATAILNYALLYRKKQRRSELILWLLTIVVLASRIIAV
ncbi:MAG: DUF6427 family protein [Bacteroidota bacterium]|nr:DUF6427 family protein [Bacteroidota bacterium]